MTEPTWRTRVAESYGKLPLFFERNEGQTDPDVRYLSQGSGYTVSLTPTEAVLWLRPDARSQAPEQPSRNRAPRQPSTDRADVVRMKLVGGNRSPEISGSGELVGKSNYFIGNDPSRWRTNIPQYERVTYREVYSGVDLVYYGTQRQLEYDFLVSPGADPDRIRLRFEGPEAAEVDADGNLVLEMGGGRVLLKAPAVYQEREGEQRRVAGGYALHGDNEVGFEVGPYDRSQALRIDPLLVYSTYLGGPNSDGLAGIAVDASGSAYVAGTRQTTPSLLSTEVWVAKLSPDGTSLLYSTLVGGTLDDQARAIAIDASGSAYVTGQTRSTDFPTLNAYQTDQAAYDGFVLKLSPAGTIDYSTYLGGNSDDDAFGIAVDGAGSAYVTGRTISTNFPTVNPYQTDQGGYDVFVTKLSSSGSSLVYSTYLGGGGVDYGYGIAVDGAGSAYVTGQTSSTDFPTVNAYQADQGDGDAFVAKLSPDGAGLVYSTYLGGTNSDTGFSIAVDAATNAYVTGDTRSADFPTLNPLATFGGVRDGFVTKLSPTGSTLAYSTYLPQGSPVGAGAGGGASGIAVDSTGSAYVVGTDGFDAFVTKLTSSGIGPAYSYSVRLAGSSFDYPTAVAVDSGGAAYVTGATGSLDFPTVNPIQGSRQGEDDAFVAKLEGTTPLGFYTLTPCRVVDTRNAVGPFGGPALACSSTPTPRIFALAVACGIPATARAVSYNLAVTQPTAAGNVRLFAAGNPTPLVSSINYSAGATRGNNGIAVLGAGNLSVTCHQPSGTAHLIIDVNGYFQ